MKLMIAIVLCLITCSCSTARVLVQDCQEMQGMDGVKNCEIVKKL
jgi:hypothetical protein